MFACFSYLIRTGHEYAQKHASSPLEHHHLSVANSLVKDGLTANLTTAQHDSLLEVGLYTVCACSAVDSLFLVKFQHVLYADVYVLSHARFTLADLTPRCCRLSQCEWVPDPASAVLASSGGRRPILNMFNIAQPRRPIGSRTCAMQLSFRGSCNK